MKSYYIIDSTGKQAGPFPGETLNQHGVTAETFVWCDGMGSNWSKAGDIEELKVLFAPAASATRPIGQRVGPVQTPVSQPAQSQPRPGAFQPRPTGNQPFGNARPQQPYAPQQQQPYTSQQPYPQQQQPYGPQQPYAQQPYTGQQYGNQPEMIKPSTNMVWAILCTLLCCLPLGIVSIIYASKVDSEWARGNYQAAKEASDKARMWALIGAGGGLIVTVLYLILVMASI